MKHLGMVRKIDDLGRLVIPKEVRDIFGIIDGTLMDMSVYGRYIMITQYEDSGIYIPERLPSPLAQDAIQKLCAMQDEDVLLCLDLMGRLSA